AKISDPLFSIVDKIKPPAKDAPDSTGAADVVDLGDGPNYIAVSPAAQGKWTASPEEKAPHGSAPPSPRADGADDPEFVPHNPEPDDGADTAASAPPERPQLPFQPRADDPELNGRLTDARADADPPELLPPVRAVESSIEFDRPRFIS